MINTIAVDSATRVIWANNRRMASLSPTRRPHRVELLGASAALAFRREEDPDARIGAGTSVALARVEAALSALPTDRLPSDAINALDRLVKSGALELDLGLLVIGAPLEGAS